ncbi:universal stress protein [Salinigranum rubrum]|uniref:Universal stress protein n=1 Tax=Salinigranum rubrum TaxID=755307 RepID=A0A2I8VGM1_9EURY|nr:universal stress protein [Salinigranum rubrum]AUV81068.1 universal stress protein [Salinigranum rubrum]
MYSVLLPVDRNTDRAFHQATYVTRLADSGAAVEATVLYVVPPNTFDRPEDVEFSTLKSTVTAADHLEEAGVSVERVVDNGGIPQKIIHTANDIDADEIVMGGRKRTGVTQVLLGSTVQDVVLSADRPVTVTGGTVTLGTGRREVLVPVDRDVDRALAQARYVANLPNAAEHVDATVCYVFPHQDYAGAPPHEFAEVDAAVEAAAYLDGEGVTIDRLVIGGEVVSKLLDTAEELDVDCIVMGGRKRSGVQKVLLGSTSQDTMLSATRPVTITG